MKNTTFEPGDKVKNLYGQIRTVLYQEDIQVLVEEELNRWYHPTKLRPINITVLTEE